MDIALIKRIGKSVLRSLFLFFVFAFVVIVSRAVFDGELENMDMLDGVAFPLRLLGLWHVFYMALIFPSALFAFHRYSPEERQAYLEKRTGVGLRAELKAVFGLLEFYVDCAVVTVLSLVMPLGLYDCIGQALIGPDFGNFPVTLIAIPFLLVLTLIAHISMGRSWMSDTLSRKEEKKKKKQRGEIFLTVKGIAFFVMAYIIASYAITWFLPFIVTVANIGGGMIVFLYLLIALMIALIVTLAAFYIRAMLKRKKFLTALNKICEEQGITLSEVQKPYWSVISQQKGTDFTLEKNGERYACKMVAAVFPSSPIAFADNGQGLRQDVLRIRGVTILHMNTLIDFRMEDEGKKIVIALPVPNKIYASVGGSTPRPADTGEIIGEYTLYTATGFLGALDRNIL